MPTMQHVRTYSSPIEPSGSIRGPNVEEKDPAVAVLSALVTLLFGCVGCWCMQNRASLRAHKVCLQLPDAGRAVIHQPKPCKSPSIPTNEGKYLKTCCMERARFVVFAGQKACGVWPFQPGLAWCGVHHDISEWQVSLEAVTRPPPVVHCSSIAACGTPIVVSKSVPVVALRLSRGLAVIWW